MLVAITLTNGPSSYKKIDALPVGVPNEVVFFCMALVVVLKTKGLAYQTKYILLYIQLNR